MAVSNVPLWIVFFGFFLLAAAVLVADDLLIPAGLPSNALFSTTAGGASDIAFSSDIGSASVSISDSGGLTGGDFIFG